MAFGGTMMVERGTWTSTEVDLYYMRLLGWWWTRYSPYYYQWR